MRVVSGDEEIKVGYNTFYWLLYNTKKYNIGYNCEYVKLPKGQFWIVQQCQINKILSAPNLTCADCRRHPCWTVLPPGEYRLQKKSSIPSYYTVYISNLNKPYLSFRELDGDKISVNSFTVLALVQTKLLPALDPMYFCKLYIDVIKINPVNIRYNDGKFNTDTPFYACVDGNPTWVPAGKWIRGYRVESFGPVFKVHYDPRYPYEVRTDVWSCGKITLLNLPKPEKHTPTPKPQPKRNIPIQKMEIYDLDYDSGYLYFRSNYSGLAELMVGKSVRKIQVKKGINKVHLTVDKETVVCVNPV